MGDVNLTDFGYELTDSAEEDSDAYTELVTGRNAHWLRTNSDHTYTQVTSTWGARCTDWDGGTPIGPFQAARVIEVINFRDLEAIGDSEINADYGYTDLGMLHHTVSHADTDARLRLSTEKQSAQLLDFPPHLKELLRG